MVGKGSPKTRIFTRMSSAASNMLTVGTVILVFFVIRRRRRRYQRNRIDELLQTRQVDYDNLLSRANPYYNSLSSEGRDRFLKRVLLFIQSKRFEYIDMEAQESAPLLISAAAVQLTYGLDHFLLDYFSTIYVVRNKYTYGLTPTPYEGHVSQDGIYLSWADFTREFADYTDGQNVGLHEMAHALTYVNFTAHEGRDATFHDAFVNFSAVARPIFERMKDGETNLLNPYAATNYQEFWGVCIETFFERSSDFKSQLPELYTALCTLLNQDPLTTEKLPTVSTL
jgi:Mlc titration factor MtfA (ptsG expression regulator)